MSLYTSTSIVPQTESLPSNELQTESLPSNEPQTEFPQSIASQTEFNHSRYYEPLQESSVCQMRVGANRKQ